jgi:acetyltransferase-like isoleucine patch superfamily enzyme
VSTESRPPSAPVPSLDRARAQQWLTKWRWYTRPQRPRNRARLTVELARREAFARGRLNGDVLGLLLDGRLELGPQVFLEPGVWLTAGDRGRIRIGGGTFLNQGVMVAAEGLVEIGAHCMAANGCLVTDGSHRFDDPDVPVPWQGFTTKGPTRIGDDVWLGANVVVTSGVTIGRRSVIGANSVVTEDVPPFSIAAGAPARVLRTITYADREPAAD